MRLIKAFFNKILNTFWTNGKEYTLFVFSTMMYAGFHFIFVIIARHYIDPYDYGIYSTCCLLQTYLAYLQLGTLNAFNRDYPQLYVKGNIEETEKYYNTVFSFLIIIYSIAFVILTTFFMLLYKYNSFEFKYLIGYILITFNALISIINDFGSYSVRVSKNFNVVSIANLIKLLPIILCLFLLPYLKYYTLYVLLICSSILGVIYYYRYLFKDFQFRIDIVKIKEIIYSGMPLLINGLIWTIVNSIDKFVILYYINTTALGTYSIAQTAFNYIILIPSAISSIFYTKMGKVYGETGNINKLCNVALKSTFILSFVTSIVSLLGYCFIPYLVALVMPKYINGVKASQILLIGMIIYSSTIVNGNILTILKYNASIIRNSIYVCIFNITFSILFVTIRGPFIENIAFGTSISYCFHSFIVMYFVLKYTKCKPLSFFLSSIIPILAIIILCVGVSTIIGNNIVLFFASIIIICIVYMLMLIIKKYVYDFGVS